MPYDLSWGAWKDPSHTRAFNERSWLYYTDGHGYPGRLEARLDLAELRMIFSPVGETLKQRGLPADEYSARRARSTACRRCCSNAC